METGSDPLQERCPVGNGVVRATCKGCNGRSPLFAGGSVPHRAPSEGGEEGWEHWKPSPSQKISHQIASPPSLQTWSHPSACRPPAHPPDVPSWPGHRPDPHLCLVHWENAATSFHCWGWGGVYKDLIVERKNGISFPFTFQGSPNPSPLVQKHTGKGFLFCLIRFKGIFVWG